MAPPALRSALVIDDEASIRRLVDIALADYGYQSTGVSRLGEALDALRSGSFDLVILDLLLSDGDSLEVLPSIRETTDALIVVLSARHDPAVVERAISLGADDYVAKPFDPDVFARRVDSHVTKLRGDGPAGAIMIGRLRFDPESGTVNGPGSAFRLGRTEARLLQVLARNIDRPLSEEEVLSQVWGPDFRGTKSYLESWIARLQHVLASESGRATIRASESGYQLFVN